MYILLWDSIWHFLTSVFPHDSQMNISIHFLNLFTSLLLSPLQLHGAAFVNNVDPWGQELRRCCRGQSPGWHHTCMKMCQSLGLAWAEANRSYCIPPPFCRVPAMAKPLPPSLPSTRLTLLFSSPTYPCCHVAVLMLLHKGLKEAQLCDSVLLPLLCLFSVGKRGTQHKR